MNSRVPADIPSYLLKTYWWAYVHPHALRVFERQWLVNTILWGNYSKLRDAALDELGATIAGDTLQVACVYGDLTARLAARLVPGARLDVVDILPLQLQGLAKKLNDPQSARLICANSANLPAADASYDRALLFFLLHEQPAEVRRHTLAEALRVVRPGGRVVIVDYHRPHPLHPLYWPMTAILRTLEPFAMDLWKHDLEHWLPEERRGARICRRRYFGGLYQQVTISV